MHRALDMTPPSQQCRMPAVCIQWDTAHCPYYRIDGGKETIRGGLPRVLHHTTGLAELLLQQLRPCSHTGTLQP